MKIRELERQLLGLQQATRVRGRFWDGGDVGDAHFAHLYKSHSEALSVGNEGNAGEDGRWDRRMSELEG